MVMLGAVYGFLREEGAMPRLKQAGRETGNPYANRDFDLLFGDRDPLTAPGTATARRETGGPFLTSSSTPLPTPPTAFASTGIPSASSMPSFGSSGSSARVTSWARSLFIPSIARRAREVGLTEAQIQGCRRWSVADSYSPVERPRWLTRMRWCLSGAGWTGIFEALQAHLSDEEILEFTYITCTYMMHAIMSRALRLEYDDVEDPVVEIAALGMRGPGRNVHGGYD